MPDVIPARLLENARLRPDAPAYHHKEGGAWKATSWGRFGEECQRAGRSLMALGFRQGDFPAAEQAAAESLALPMYPEISEAQQVFVVEQIVRFYHG